MRIGRSTIAVALATAVAVGCSSSDDAKTSSGLPASCAGQDPTAIPDDLVCTGLYSNVATLTISGSNRFYAPAVPFWSDGLDKDRYIYLPPGTTIDDSNPDEWNFPVGTKVWKDIHKGTTKVETRYFVKIDDSTWQKGSYVWDADGKTAKSGAGNDITVDGAPYHVPDTSECDSCHHGRKDKLLGFEAISLGQNDTLKNLADENLLSPPPSRTSVTLPDPAYAILHVNCGITCHNDNPGATAFDTKLHMRLGFDEIKGKPAAQWELSTTLIGVDTTSPNREGKRIAPGSPDTSALVAAMGTRGDGQMPPIATTVVDSADLAKVKAWITNLPH